MIPILNLYEWGQQGLEGGRILDSFQPLNHFLDDWVYGYTDRSEVAETILAIIEGCVKINDHVARSGLQSDNGKIVGDNADGDAQKGLDVLSNKILINQLQDLPVAQIISEEIEEAVVVDPNAHLIVAFDPLDGSSNIDTNVSIGTIFSIYDLDDGHPAGDIKCDALLGTNQRAAGYVIYGPGTMLVLTCGDGTHIFTLDPKTSKFHLTGESIKIPTEASEFAVNLSNYRHWDEHIRTYIDDCLDGEKGVRKENYNMRWVASLVAECHRIFSRGGIFLYPGDHRPGYANGRLRLLYEANAVAFLVEQAGGAATTGHGRVLEVEPTEIHQRVPLIFGSKAEVERVERYYAELHHTGIRSPLFEYRGLFRS
ncbi:MAG: class 1 fructose-bisphosphatase [Rhodospirillaceae bacterium]|jgi:fructose-1,6-bisphosphatase I|nr:class 1 fructose-bisphosphatase [Rhodospirillaceae bacterium]MBT5939689.1 class 1 fructose-bisphosphatase [Rhodospirillaceae bacterium]MBT7267272.1 class 1 fructose-bisphosphatase [Rhodospirillaceae bacterium]